MVNPGDMVSFKASATDPAATIKRGRVQRVLHDEKGFALVVKSKGKEILILEVQLVEG